MITITKNDGLQIVALERPEKANSINRLLLSELHSTLKGGVTSDIKCLVITGSGEKVFCAGADLDERLNMSREEIIDYLDLFRDMLLTLELIEVPTIALMNGSAFGGGLELALACDIRLAREGIQVGLTETKLGIIPGAGGTQRLSRLIGCSNAMDLIFRGVRLNSSDALRYGILNHVYSPSTFYEEFSKYVREITTSAPLALKFAKHAIRGGLKMSLEDGLNFERNQYLKTLSTKDRAEALQAFKEKRKPIFRGE